VGLKWLDCSNCPNLLIQRNLYESSESYETRWKPIREEIQAKERSNERCWLLEEKLIESVYHPDRVERWLTIGGDALLDTMFDVKYSFNTNPEFRAKKRKVVPTLI
jgi:CDP-glycerol glycerophosphotransferase (TagB/SpsB family)